MDQERISALVEKYWDKVKEHRYYMHNFFAGKFIKKYYFMHFPVLWRHKKACASATDVAEARLWVSGPEGGLTCGDRVWQ